MKDFQFRLANEFQARYISIHVPKDNINDANAWLVELGYPKSNFIMTTRLAPKRTYGLFQFDSHDKETAMLFKMTFGGR